MYAYVGGDPVGYIDPLGLGTIAVGGQAGANAIGVFNLSLQVSISWNSAALLNLSQWRVGGVLSITPFTGVSTGFGAAAGALFTYSQANCPEQFNGWSGTFGGSGGVGVVAGGDVGNVGYGNPKTGNLFIGAGYEISPEFYGAPVEFHAASSYTVAGSFAL